jgi:hypothetical protein
MRPVAYSVRANRGLRARNIRLEPIEQDRHCGRIELTCMHGDPSLLEE